MVTHSTVDECYTFAVVVMSSSLFSSFAMRCQSQLKNTRCRSTILAMLDLDLHLSEYAILTDEASANFHVGTDGRDNAVAGAMVGCPTKALS